MDATEIEKCIDDFGTDIYRFCLKLCADKTDGEMEKQRNDCPFLEKFMLPPDNYEIFKFGGSSIKDEERGIQTMLKYFSSYFTEEQLKKNMTQYNLQTMFDIVKKYFAKESGGSMNFSKNGQSFLCFSISLPPYTIIQQIFQILIVYHNRGHGVFTGNV